MRYVDVWECPKCGYRDHAKLHGTPETDNAVHFCDECIIHRSKEVEMEVLEYDG